MSNILKYLKKLLRITSQNFIKNKSSTWKKSKAMSIYQKKIPRAAIAASRKM